MQTLTPISPFSDLRSKPKQILAKLKESPVVLTLRGRPSAVLLDYDAYNRMVQRQQELEQMQVEMQNSYSSMAEAAQYLLDDYMNDEELTAFTALDGEPIHAA